MTFLTFLSSYIFDIFFYIALALLLSVVFLQVSNRLFLRRHASRIFLYSAGLVGAYLITVSFLQFRAFHTGPLGIVLGSKILWFLQYVFFRFWNDYVLSLFMAIIFVLIAYYFNRKHNERYFEREEPFLAALGILLVGYPGVLFYIPITLLISAVASAILVKNKERLPLYHFWLPTAIIVLGVIHFWVGDQSWWGTFRF